ncbi:hypothetical protein CPB86DRAFT_778456 [Serendipita vermifera]|nr:hypothetical protein CPB86DRAFT_778456 [Serendipita vermifera]
MTIINTIIATSVVALGFVAQNAAPVNALAAGNPHAARHAGHSTNHGGVLRRKRSSHKHRKRCIAQQVPSVSSDLPAPTDSSNNGYQGDNNNNNNDSGSNNNNNNTPYVPPATGPACSGGKMLLAWGYDLSTTFMPSAITSKTCYYYNWSPWPTDPSLTNGLNFIPMFWSAKQHSEYHQNVLDNGSRPYAVLAMNEVNEGSQANMSVEEGLRQWREYIMPMRERGTLLGSPSVTSAPSGKDWLVQFTNSLGDNEKPDFYAVHWYDVDADAFINYVTDIHNTFGKSVWITEFACTDFSGQGRGCDVPAFTNKVKPFLENTDWIGSYAPFGFVGSMVGVSEDNRLMGWDGKLTGLGATWIY